MGDDGIKPHYVIPDAEEHLYDVTAFGRTTLTTVTIYSKAVAQWIKEVQPDDVVPRFIGFDAKMFYKDGKPSIGTIQFCVGDRCLVIQGHNRWMSISSESLEEFLVDQNNTFVGINMDLKLGTMLQHLPPLPGGVQYKDVRELAADMYRLPMLRSAGHRELAETVLGMTVETPAFEKDWYRAEKLSDAQVYCACVDAYASFLLGRWLCRV